MTHPFHLRRIASIVTDAYAVDGCFPPEQQTGSCLEGNVLPSNVSGSFPSNTAFHPQGWRTTSLWLQASHCHYGEYLCSRFYYVSYVQYTFSSFDWPLILSDAINFPRSIKGSANKSLRFFHCTAMQLYYTDNSAGINFSYIFLALFGDVRFFGTLYTSRLYILKILFYEIRVNFRRHFSVSYPWRRFFFTKSPVWSNLPRWIWEIVACKVTSVSAATTTVSFVTSVKFLDHSRRTVTGYRVGGYREASKCNACAFRNATRFVQKESVCKKKEGD